MRTGRTALWAGLLAAGLLSACGGNASTPQPPTATPTATVSPTAGPIIWEGDHAPFQMDLIGTITSSPTPLGQVRGVALDREGDVYVVDSANSRVLKYDSTGKFLMQWGSQGSGDGQFDMSLYYDIDRSGFVAVDSLGNVYVTENARVQKFDSNGNFLTKWGAPGSGDGQFALALAIAIDPKDNVYVVDLYNNVVQKFDRNGKFLLKWGSPGSGEGQFKRPAAVAIDRQGHVLVADVDTGRLQRFDSNGKFLSQVFLGGVDSEVIGPIALAVGDQGQVYIGEYAHGRVVEFDSSGKLLAAWGDTGAYDEQMSEAGGLALGKDGTVYVADAFNHRVLIFRQH